LRRAAQERGQAVSAERLALANWTLLITNTPAELLATAEVLVVAHCRWQIELLFKLWKSQGHLAQSRSAKPWRQLCEIYAKLLGLLLQHWLWLLGAWDKPDRSLFKAAQVTQQFALSLACALSHSKQLQAILLTLQRCLTAGCRTNKRRQYPATFQCLLAIEHA
jgi:DDE family transposase